MALNDICILLMTLNDTIEFLKVILKECCFAYIVLIISLIAAALASLVLTFNTIKTHGILFALSSFSCSFYENLDKKYQEIPCFTPFILPFTPLIFAF